MSRTKPGSNAPS